MNLKLKSEAEKAIRQFNVMVKNYPLYLFK